MHLRTREVSAYQDSAGWRRLAGRPPSNTRSRARGSPSRSRVPPSSRLPARHQRPLGEEHALFQSSHDRRDRCTRHLPRCRMRRKRSSRWPHRRTARDDRPSVQLGRNPHSAPWRASRRRRAPPAPTRSSRAQPVLRQDAGAVGVAGFGVGRMRATEHPLSNAATTTAVNAGRIHRGSHDRRPP